MSGEQKKSAKGAGNQPAFTWAQAVRDIFVTSMNRGQLPVLGMIAVALLVLYRMPPEGLAALTHEVVTSLKNGELWAYLLELATVVAWYVHARSMRRNFSDEAERIGREKSKIQSQAAGVAFKTSNRPSGRR